MPAFFVLCMERQVFGMDGEKHAQRCNQTVDCARETLLDSIAAAVAHARLRGWTVAMIQARWQRCAFKRSAYIVEHGRTAAVWCWQEWWVRVKFR